MPYEVKWTIMLTKCYVKTQKVVLLTNQTSSYYFVISKLISIDCYINDKFYICYQKGDFNNNNLNGIERISKMDWNRFGEWTKASCKLFHFVFWSWKLVHF